MVAAITVSLRQWRWWNVLSSVIIHHSSIFWSMIVSVCSLVIVFGLSDLFFASQCLGWSTGLHARYHWASLSYFCSPRPPASMDLSLVHWNTYLFFSREWRNMSIKSSSGVTWHDCQGVQPFLAQVPPAFRSPEPHLRFSVAPSSPPAQPRDHGPAQEPSRISVLSFSLSSSVLPGQDLFVWGQGNLVLHLFF